MLSSDLNSQTLVWGANTITTTLPERQGIDVKGYFEMHTSKTTFQRLENGVGACTSWVHQPFLNLLLMTTNIDLESSKPTL